MSVRDVVLVNGVGRTKTACYAEALRIDPNSAHIWRCFGASMATNAVVNFNNVDFTQKMLR